FLGALVNALRGLL
uniref:Temporin-1To n=1 Tax=Rana temporaria TaxID=8407 RepID=TPO_RANTE|nr:RecName: Full=Temporin-1To; AltName: Full=Temporin-O [Rana temporaria]